MNAIDNQEYHSKKVLVCNYAINQALKSHHIPIKEVLEKLTKIIPQGFVNTNVCEVRIRINNIVIKSDAFKKSDSNYEEKIIINRRRVGDITVVYLPKENKKYMSFTQEEKDLLSTISDKLSDYIDYREMKKFFGELRRNVTDEEIALKSPLGKWLTGLGLTKEEVNDFTQKQIFFKKGETICKQGTSTSYVMLLAEGLAKNYLESSFERGFNYKIVKPFDFIGLTTMYSNDTYIFSISAITKTSVYLIDKQLFKNVIYNNVVFAEAVMYWYCEIAESHLKRISCLGNKQALGRISEILLYLSETVFDSGKIESMISRKDIAELAGMSTESAVRIISDLKKDKIVQITPKGIQILNSDLLRKFSSM